ncbi:class I SAM-dependent methyltransferase [Castellaniella ginsengisoli]|uniref:Class I SAM-dependent methyltransferase n=1 Tax=Castellaniella ginsengisoli TaxID=546114 RepID=A0AB39EQ29_9BURK
MDNRLIRHPFGFLTVANKPTLKELKDYYANKYYQQALGSYEREYSAEEKAYFRNKIAQRHSVLKRISPRSRSMLDVGCGEGFSLSYFREQGWFVKGFDFSRDGVESQNPSCRDALVVGDVFELLEEEISSGSKYDVVWLQNVLEHVLDPIALLISLKALLAPGGAAVITVPNDFSSVQREALARGYIEQEFWVALPDHLSYFDHVSLPATAKGTGWDCVELLGDFPIDWFLFHGGSNYVRDRALGKAAHHARVQLENLIHNQPMDFVVEFWAIAGRLGIGRDITAFLKA